MTTKRLIFGGAITSVALLIGAVSAAAEGVTLNQEQSLNWWACVNKSDAIEVAQASVADTMAGTAVWTSKMAQGLCERMPRPIPMTPLEVVYEGDFAIGPSGKLRVLLATITKPDGSFSEVYVILSDKLIDPLTV